MAEATRVRRRTAESSKNSSLDTNTERPVVEVAEKKKTRPRSIVLYGPSNVGKTSLTANIPNVGFIHDNKERGIVTLVEEEAVPTPLFIHEIGEWNELLDKIDAITIDDCQTLVIEAVTGIERLCFQHHCNENFGGDWSKQGFFAFQQGPQTAAKTDWPILLGRIDDARKRGVSTILTAHAQTKTEMNPEGPDWTRYSVYSNKETWQVTKAWAQAVIFFNFNVQMKETGLRNKADMDFQRLLCTTWSPAYDAKNWLRLPATIDAGEDPAEGGAALAKALKI